MFYTQNVINWPYWAVPENGKSEASFQGTWISTKNITISGHFKFAGQIIANKIIFKNDVAGDFRYVPIDPPEIDPTIFAGREYWEADSAEIIPFELSKEPGTNVTFKYCYSFYSSSSCRFGDGYCAEKADLSDSLRKMPICGVDTATVLIPKGSKVPTDSTKMAWIHAKWDRTEEKDEYLKIEIINLAGAVVKYDDATFFDSTITVTLKLRDRDTHNDPPEFICKDENGNDIPCDSLLKVVENKAGDLAGTVVATDKETPNKVTFALVGQYDARGKDVDIFEMDTLSGEVKLKDGIAVNYEVNQYFGVDIMAKDPVGGATIKSFRVTVRDVNENPIIVGNTDLGAINTKTYTADEDFPDGKLVGKVVVGDIDSLHMETDSVKFRDNIVKAVGGDTAIFHVSEKGIITVAHGDSLDYEKDSIYTLLIRAQDRKDSNLFDTTTITIKINDKDDPPHFDTTHVDIIIPPDTTDPGYDPDTDPDTTKNLIKLDRDKGGSVKENNPANVVVGAIKATCTDTTKTLIYTIVKDTSGLFTLDPITGVVTVKDPMVFDYERVIDYEITVKVSDGVDAGNGETADGVIVQSSERKVVIRVIDVNEAPEIEPQKFAVNEELPVGTVIEGKLTSTDPDTNHYYAMSTYSALKGDTALFHVNEDGTIETKTVMDYEKYAATGDTVFTLVVEVKNVLGNDGKVATETTALWDTATVTIVLRNVNEPPAIITDTVRVKENSEGGTVVDTVEAVDPENPNETITFTQVGTSDFEVSEDGVITVKKGAKIDYEKTPVLKITVKVSDSHGVSQTKDIVVVVEDVNEPPTIDDQVVTFSEDDPIGTKKGPLVADDPDKDPKNSTLKFSLVGKSEMFEVLEDGKVKLLDSLDYERDSVYYITVRVTDGEYSDTAKVTIRIKNVVEYSEVKITQAENTDSLWKFPDTLYVNKPDIDFCWSEGIKGSSNQKEYCADTTLTPGKTKITRKYYDPTTDHPGVATLIVFYSTAAPEVSLTKDADPEFKANIYTIVEKAERDETTFFINSKKTVVKVAVTDTAADVHESFSIKLELDNLSIPSKYYTTMASIADDVLPLNESAKGAIRTPINGEKIAVSYTEIVNGIEIEVTYYTDMKGNILKGESGKEEMTVSYTKTIDGKQVTMSFQANAATGRLIETKDGASYTVSYDFVDSKKNSVHVAYDVDEKGKIVKDSNGDIGYSVSYSYVNKYGNSAVEQVKIVLDTKPPMVWIKSPVKDQVINSNMVAVEWYVSVSGDSADFKLQDTLNLQGLENGANPIVRFFIDKAGNTASDTVFVIMKGSKDVDIAVEKPVTIITADKVSEYYTEDNMPVKNQTFAVSIANPSTDEEKETQIGGSFKTKKGSGEQPYPGKKAKHLGPTLGVDVKLPVYTSGGVFHSGGLATLDDLLGKDGMIAEKGLDADGGKKYTVDEYVDNFCTADFGATYQKNNKDLSGLPLYNTKMKVKIWVYTTLGTFVDYYTFTQELNDPDYVNEAGLLKMYFELKPDKEGYVRTESGKLYATGAYIYKTEVELISDLNCTLPPIGADNNLTMGSVRKTSDDMTKSFGYKRPDYKK